MSDFSTKNNIHKAAASPREDIYQKYSENIAKSQTVGSVATTLERVVCTLHFVQAHPHTNSSLSCPVGCLKAPETVSRNIRLDMGTVLSLDCDVVVPKTKCSKRNNDPVCCSRVEYISSRLPGVWGARELQFLIQTAVQSRGASFASDRKLLDACGYAKSICLGSVLI